MPEPQPPRPACHGLIAGWRLAPGAAPQPMTAADADAWVDSGDGAAWLHFDLLDARARNFIHALPGLPAAARAALVEAEEATRVETGEDALFGCLPDTHYDAEDAALPPIGMLHFALLPRLLVTARRHPLRGVHIALAAPAATTPPEALAAALHGALAEFGRGIAGLAQRLAHIEDQLLRPGAEPPRDALALVRREALRFARHLDPLAEAMEELAETDDAEPAWLRAASAPLLREGRRARGAARALAAINERGRIAQDQAAALAAEETNRRLLVLSVISAAMLPASLVAGIFGMNVGGVPGVPAETAAMGWGFAMAMGCIVASVVGVLAALRLGRLL
jgi:zinc transporter